MMAVEGRSVGSLVVPATLRPECDQTSSFADGLSGDRGKIGTSSAPCGPVVSGIVIASASSDQLVTHGLVQSSYVIAEAVRSPLPIRVGMPLTKPRSEERGFNRKRMPVEADRQIGFPSLPRFKRINPRWGFAG